MGRIKYNKVYRIGYMCIGIYIILLIIYVCEFNICLKTITNECWKLIFQYMVL